jgi:predicted Zn-dependent protease
MSFISFKLSRLAPWLGLCLAACASVNTTQGGRVGVDRQQSMLVSSADINRQAEKSYAQTLNQASEKHRLNVDAAQVARVRAIAQRLIPATGAFRADAPRWKWEVNVIAAPEANAWCMPGGKIAVYSGLLEGLKLNDAELAAVMGHEIAHALREHGREQASQSMLSNLGLSILGAAVGLSPAQVDLAGTVSNVTFLLPHSRQFETEADRIGIELAARAGYDPQAAISLWEKMMRSGGSAPPQWLSTHPSHENRIADLRHYAELVEPLYEAARPTRRGVERPVNEAEAVDAVKSGGKRRK